MINYANIKPDKLLSFKFSSFKRERKIIFNSERELLSEIRMMDDLYTRLAKKHQLVYRVTYDLPYVPMTKTIEYLPYDLPIND